jgi:quercetin dioxygenase-like cupin family protein
VQGDKLREQGPGRDLQVSVTRWPHREQLSAEALQRILLNQGLSPSWWSNGPGDRYAEHSHSYHKVLYCLSGSIRFICAGEAIDLSPGDRMEIPPGRAHSAVVGPHGVRCVEAARR